MHNYIVYVDNRIYHIISYRVMSILILILSSSHLDFPFRKMLTSYRCSHGHWAVAFVCLFVFLEKVVILVCGILFSQSLLFPALCWTFC